MIRARGLGRALGRVIGRALSREVSHDADEGPQRRRPTTSARRQWEVTPIAEDVKHVDHATKEVHEQPQEAPAADVVSDVEGFPDRPHNTSVLMDYVHHVTVIVWNEEERFELKLFSHGRKVEKFGRSAPKIESLVVVTGLSPLIACSLDNGDRGLVSTFAERWHKETSSFHLLVGGVSITLDDMASLLHLTITGTFNSFEVLHVNDVVFLLVELLEVSSEEARAETIQCHGAYVRLSWLRDIYRSKCDVAKWTMAAPTYLLHLLGCTLFANKSATHVHVVFLDAFRDLMQSGSYA
ncbi:protein MAIN-LIKE 2-like [Glycine max]|uniref:protein MAIN-LIKE 2-like n=1 Tax=Glycine max TaxID=3847 RepID=UPI0003DE87EC|nr:protein MAIN-LIKE 2-like [Glycine max]|eukprot:XP_006579230.1 protein MAIN-LIKE 2-like [Glycine max]